MQKKSNRLQVIVRQVAIFCFLTNMPCVLPSAYSSEDITISTYYPSPCGIYQSIRMYPTNDQAGFAGIGSDCSNNGEIYYSNSAHVPLLCNAGKWIQLGTGSGPSTWDTNYDNGAEITSLYPATDSWNVAIGSQDTSTYKLNVEGKFKADNLYAKRYVIAGCGSRQCTTTLNFDKTFSEAPVVICTGEPNVCKPSDGCGDDHADVVCSIISVTTTQVTVRYGTNRSSAGKMNKDKVLNIFAMEPTD